MSARKLTRKQLTAKADKLFSQVIRQPGRCENCGGHSFLQCAHGISRRYHAVRWDLRNAFPLCRSCHVYFTHRPLEWDDWLIERWGALLYKEMRSTALRGERVDLEAVIQTLEVRAA